MREVNRTDVEQFSKKQGEPKSLLDKRLQALHELNKNESTIFRYGLNISTSFEADYTKLELLRPAAFTITQNSAVAVNLKDAYKNKAFIENFMKNLNVDNRLISMNIAFMNSGVFVQLPARKDSGTIQLKLDSGEADFSYILVLAEEGSTATIIEEASGDKSEYRSTIVEVVAKTDSSVRYGTIQKLPESRNYSLKTASIDKDANVEWLEIAMGATTTKAETYSELVGNGAKTTMFNVFFGNRKQQFDILNKCNHIGRNTESLMLTSGALKDSAKAIQQGFAKINPKAFGAAAHQKAKILLLSENAKAAAIPKLEIDNNDVAATHEAAVGQIDTEKIFYLMSRGLDESEAKKVYVEGFFEQYASKIDVPELREDVLAIIAERMK